jgi:hypothetical protein
MSWDDKQNLHNFISALVWVGLIVFCVVQAVRGFWKDEKFFKSGRVTCGCLGAIILLFFGLTVIGHNAGSGKANAEAEVKHNLFNIKTALEKYAVDHKAVYPLNFNDLVSEHYLGAFPVNPFTGQEMRNIEMGSIPFDGEYTYIPIVLNGSADPSGYFILAYGHKTTIGFYSDYECVPDHIILLYGFPTEECSVLCEYLKTGNMDQHYFEDIQPTSMVEGDL